jgi:hypothetical protein
MITMHLPLSLKDVEIRYEQIHSKAKSTQLKTNLQIVQTMLLNLHSKGIKPTISALVKHLNSKGPSISTRSFYNARAEGNLYRELYDAWELFWHTKPGVLAKAVESADKATSADIMDYEAVNDISDPFLKYQLKLLLTEYKNLKNQNNLLRNKVVNTPIEQLLINPAKKVSRSREIFLDKADIEIINKFLYANFDTEFSESGELIVSNHVRKGTVISAPGLKQALVELMKSVS